MNLKRDLRFTKREIEIISLIADGKENIEISEVLFISSRTVETHRKNILNKLRVKNFYAVLSYAYKNNILNID